MQEVPGFGVLRSDNPIVAEVLRTIALDMYPEGTAEGNVPRSAEESQSRLENSEILQRLGGLGLIRDFAEELEMLSIHPIELMLNPLAHLGAAFSVGVQVGAVLERRAAEAPRFD